MITNLQKKDSVLVKQMNLAILKNVLKKKLNIKEPEIIDKRDFENISNELMKAILIKNESLRIINRIKKELNSPKEIQKIKTNPILEKTRRKINEPFPKRNPQFIQRSPNRNIPQQNKVIPKQAPAAPIKKYGKIDFLIKDNTISLIQCLGPEKQINVVQRGQRHPIPLTLNQEEIDKILETFSEEVHIPIIEGPFQATVNNLNVSGIYSSLVGSNFIIKKQ